MVSEARKQSMAWMEIDYSKHSHFLWKIKWRLENLGTLGIMDEIAPLTYRWFPKFSNNNNNNVTSENDLRSCEATWAVAKKVQKKIWGSNGIRTHDLRDTGAMLYPMSWAMKPRRTQAKCNFNLYPLDEDRDHFPLFFIRTAYIWFVSLNHHNNNNSKWKQTSNFGIIRYTHSTNTVICYGCNFTGTPCTMTEVKKTQH